MTSRKYLLLFLVHGFVACGFQSQTYSDELKIFTSRAVATVLEKIGPEFEKNTGHTLNITTGLSSEFVGRIIAGEAFDVVAAPPPVLDGLVKSEKVTAESKTGLVRSANGGRPSQTLAPWEASSGRSWTQNRSPTFLCTAYRK
jgi:ABC-type molybdate transport system substrate-binding protein